MSEMCLCDVFPAPRSVSHLVMGNETLTWEILKMSVLLSRVKP